MAQAVRTVFEDSLTLVGCDTSAIGQYTEVSPWQISPAGAEYRRGLGWFHTHE